MKTAIVTDTGAYLKPEEIEKYNIKVLPITVIMGDSQYKETEELDAETFFDYMRNEAALPTTAQVSIGAAEELYNQLADEGYDEVISIHLSRGITSFLDSLEGFLKTYNKIKVYPYDSTIAAAGEADLCLLAATMALDGKHANEIMPQLARLTKTLNVDFVVDDLKHLTRTGRLSNRSAIIGNLLRIKPMLTFEDGKIVAVGRERTMKRAFGVIKSDLRKTLEENDYPVLGTILDANYPELSDKWLEELQREFPNVRFDQRHLGPAISVHTGEKTMALIWERDWKSLT